MNIAILAISAGGRRLAEKLGLELGAARIFPRTDSVTTSLHEAWAGYDALVCIMSAGIVVRAIAPLCRDKYADPCVVVLDEAGKFVVSLLSGHLGGGNALARRIALLTGGLPVITTASDTLGLTALDLWARDNGLLLRSSRRLMTEAAARMVNAGSLRIFTDCEIFGLPDDFHRVDLPEDADIIVSAKANPACSAVHFSPCNLFVGIGCNRGTSADDISRAVDETCQRNGLDKQAIAGYATIDAKIDEEGLIQFARDAHMPVHYFNHDRLNTVAGISESEYAMAALGVKAVAEPAAILAACYDGGKGKLIIRKMKWKDVTTAVAERPLLLRG
ncbi:MAG: cobalamin biosynthesis protein CbiG [Desulfobulbaceae bacterium]|jgi:cobalt-precorrin 5A hydrolase|nr:MAG: cobalamin biosynthesis protein CbiG [Desulfobulbaceae bacterium]